MKEILKQSGYVKSFDGTKLYFERKGEGSPMVFAYGIGCLFNHWAPQLKFFSQKHESLIFDYRGHHKSDLPEKLGDMTVDAVARDLILLLENQGVSQAHFLGHSFGAQVLIRAYDLKPELFKSLTFVNGFANNPMAEMFGNGAAEQFFHFLKGTYESLPSTAGYLWRKIIDTPITAQMSGFLGGFNLSLTQLKDIEIYARGIGSMNLGAFIHLFESMMSYDGLSVLEHIQCPTLIIGGQKDNVTPEKFQEEMYNRIPNSELLMVPYGSHCTQLDMPDFVNLKIDEFIQKVEK